MAVNSINFCLSEKVFLICFLWIICRVQNFMLVGSFLSTVQIFYSCAVSEEKSNVILIFSEVKVFFPTGFFGDFFF